MSIETRLELIIVHDSLDRITIRNHADHDRILAWIEDDVCIDERLSIARLFAASDEMYNVICDVSHWLHMLPNDHDDLEFDRRLYALRLAIAHAKGATIRPPSPEIGIKVAKK